MLIFGNATTHPNELRVLPCHSSLGDQTPHSGRAQQLKAISHLSALIAGFAMIVMVEIQLPDNLHVLTLMLFGTTSALVVGIMLIAMLNCTMMLIAILKYDCVNRNPPFHMFWRVHCEDDWHFAYRSFTFGLPLFMCVLAQIGWIQFHKYDDSTRNLGASAITFVAAVTFSLWFLHTKSKWGNFIRDADVKLVQEESQNIVVANGLADLSGDLVNGGAGADAGLDGIGSGGTLGD